jgi:hypothetical protein
VSGWKRIAAFVDDFGLADDEALRLVNVVLANRGCLTVQ